MTARSQIVFIHGGDSFPNQEEFYEFLRQLPVDPNEPERKRWRDWLKAETASTHDFLMPMMPNKLNADYIAWSIWFEKYLPHLKDGVVLIGHSLGGSFLLRYLTDHQLPIWVKQLHLVAPAIDEVDCPGVGAFAIDVSDWPGFKTDVKGIHIWHSSDDTIVPVHHSERLSRILPSATVHIFGDRFHFLEESFPELLESIKMSR